MRFQDKVALITAAASGIGRATADIMAREGAIVIAVDNNEERLDRTVAALRETGGRAHRRLCNALDEADVNATVGSVLQEFGAIDILVNAVGGSTIIPKSGAPVEELSFADWQKLIDFNLSGTFLFTHAVVPAMKEQAAGRDRQSGLDRRTGPQHIEQQRLCRGEGRHHRLHAQARLRTRALWDHDQRDRAEPHPDRAHPAALGAAEPGRPAGRDRAHPAAPRRRGRRPGQGDLFSGVGRRRVRDRRHDRRDRGELTGT